MKTWGSYNRGGTCEKKTLWKCIVSIIEGEEIFMNFPISSFFINIFFKILLENVFIYLLFKTRTAWKPCWRWHKWCCHQGTKLDDLSIWATELIPSHQTTISEEIITYKMYFLLWFLKIQFPYLPMNHRRPSSNPCTAGMSCGYSWI